MKTLKCSAKTAGSISILKPTHPPAHPLWLQAPQGVYMSWPTPWKYLCSQHVTEFNISLHLLTNSFVNISIPNTPLNSISARLPKYTPNSRKLVRSDVRHRDRARGHPKPHLRQNALESESLHGRVRTKLFLRRASTKFFWLFALR